MRSRSISVLGLGLMGSAIARVLIDQGHRVTVWNRSEEKAASFRERATVAPTILSAVLASDLIMVCVLNYEASDALLRQPDVTAALSGRTLVQFSSGTPRDARDAASWAAGHGLKYLDCTMSGGPQHVGSDLGTFHYTGSRELFAVMEDVLTPLIGTTSYCGEEWGYAAALDFARLGTFTGVMTVLGNVLALIAAEHVAIEDFLSEVPFLSADFLHALAEVVASDHFPSGTATLTTWRSWADLFVRAERDARVDPRMAEFVRDAIATSIDRGHADDDVYAVFAAFDPPDD